MKNKKPYATVMGVDFPIRYRVRDIWHPHINGKSKPWVYSDSRCFEGNANNFFAWIGQHTSGKLDGLEIVWDKQ